MANRYGGSMMDRLCAIVVLAGLLCSVLLESRSFLLGFAAAGCYVAATSPNLRQKKYLPFISAVLLAGLLGFLVFFVKSDSSKGRLLIYKVSSAMFRDHYAKGMGPARFKADYLSYQAAYFRNGDYTEQELLVADNTYFAFNDYWQFIIEHGIPGMLVLGVVGISLLYAVIRLPANQKGQLPYGFAVIALIAISLAACFNHLFEKLSVQLIFLSSILVLGWGYLSHINRILPFYLAGSMLLVGLLAFRAYGHQLIHRQAYRHWKTSQTMSRAGFVTEGLQHGQVAAHSLAHNGSFMEYYGQQLMRARRYQQAIAVFNQALNYRRHHRIYLHLGSCYQEVGRMEDAEQALLTAVYTAPNRFESRFALFEHYRASGRIEEARFWGRSILILPVKIPSIRVDQIRKSVTERLEALETGLTAIFDLTIATQEQFVDGTLTVDGKTKDKML